MAKRVIDIQSPEEAEVLKATRKKIKERRLNKKKDADKLSAGEFPELQKIKKAVDELLKSAVADGKIDKAWNLKRLAQVGTKPSKSWRIVRIKGVPCWSVKVARGLARPTPHRYSAFERP